MKTNLSCASFGRLGLATAGLAVLLAGCGGGSSSPSSVAVAPQTKSVPATQSVVNAIVATTPLSVTFSNGFSGTTTITGATTLTISPPSAGSSNPNFSISNNGNTADGYMTFGSCDFYPKGHPNPLQADSAKYLQVFGTATVPFVVNPCSLSLAVPSVVVNTGASANANVQTKVVLGSTTSTSSSAVTFVVDSIGNINAGSTTVTTVTVSPYTGTGTGSGNP